MNLNQKISQLQVLTLQKYSKIIKNNQNFKRRTNETHFNKLHGFIL